MKRNEILLIGLTICFFSFLSAGGIVLKDVTNPMELKIQDNCFFISELNSCKVYKCDENGNVLVTIGEKGQGPAETTGISNFQVFKNEIHISSSTKNVFFNQYGDYINEIKYLSPLNVVLKLNTGWIVGKNERKKNKLVYSINYYDPNFNNVRPLMTVNLPTPFASKIEVVEHCYRMETFGNSIIIANTTKGCFFSLFTSDGKFQKNIEKKDYPKVQLSDDWKGAIRSELQKSPVIARNWGMIEKKLYFPENFPAFQDYAVSDDGLILIRTYYTKGNKSLYLLISDWGETVDGYYLPLEIEFMNRKRHFCLNEKFISYIIENIESENYELYKVPIDQEKYAKFKKIRRINFK